MVERRGVLEILFEPDALMVYRYFQAHKRKTYIEPEKNLMMVILEDALYLFQKNILATKGKGLSEFLEAKEWFFGPDGGNWLFSFSRICEILDFDEENLRKGLRLWSEKYSSGELPPPTKARNIPKRINRRKIE